MNSLNAGEILKSLKMKMELKYFKKDWCLFQKYWGFSKVTGFTRTLRRYFALLSLKKSS